MLKPGMFISDRYEIIDKVGSGGMADVYKAKCHRLNRFVAIKVLKSEFSDDKNFVKKFRGEAQSAAGLSHPNIVNVYDVGDDNGLHYIVMELVEGITLKSFIERKGKLEVKEAVGIAIQIAMGMEAAHINHIIHRDIKPQNIIISREGKVKVTDFGIAKATTSNTITSNAMGSVHYLSPEQARGGYSDEKSDIYSLGVTLYEMLTGQVPFAGDNTVSVALLHIQGEAIPLREINPSIPYSIEKIVQKCMQKKPERRYLTASELMGDLKRSISNPNGDFVVISSGIVTDSPTITISEEDVNVINKAAFAQGLAQNTRRPQTNTSGMYTSNKSSMGATRGASHDTKGFEPVDAHTEDGFATDAKRRPLDTEIEEEDELDSVDPRIEKLIMVATIAAGVVLTIVVLYFVIRFFNLFNNDSKDKKDNATTIEATVTPTPTEGATSYELIAIPSVVGLKLADAESTLYAKSDAFRITYKEEYSDESENGFIIEQYPQKGAEIAGNGEIILTISSGSEPLEIPDVYNRTEEQAIEKLTSLKFKVVNTYEASTEFEEGRVIRTIPERLTQGVKGQEITIVVSSGPEVKDVIVPTLVSLTQEEVIKSLEEVGLIKGEVTTVFSDLYAAGTVMKQGIAGGSTIPQGSAVDITISLGKVQVTSTPTPTIAPTPEPEDAEDVSYESSITITNSDNPFEYPGEKGIIIVELEQDGATRNLMKAEKSYESFPLTIPSIESDSDSKGTIRMYVGEYVEAGEEGAVKEGNHLVKYTQYGTSWAINFSKVED